MVSMAFFYKDCIGIKYSSKVNMPLKKKRNRNVHDYMSQNQAIQI